MSKRSGIITIITVAVVILALAFFPKNHPVSGNSPGFDFCGEGTEGIPYQLKTPEDLYLLREYVDQGEHFQGVFFELANDIALDPSVSWVPIGAYGSGNYFCGTLDGRGHAIDGLFINAAEKESNDACVGFFGQFGGTVVNLGLTNVDITGNCCGGVTCGIVENGNEPAIMSCFVTGKIRGNRVAGIAENFAFGEIISCISDVQLIYVPEYDAAGNISNAGGISSTVTEYMAYNCYSTAKHAMPDAGTHALCGHIDKDMLSSGKSRLVWKVKTTLAQAMAQELFGNKKHVQLREWHYDGDSISVSKMTSLRKFLHFINLFLVPIILLLCILFTVRRVRRSHTKWYELNDVYHAKLVAAAIFCGVISTFSDAAALGTAREMLNIGNILFLLLINALFLFFLFLLRKDIATFFTKTRKGPILVVVFIIIILECLQFGRTPRYDAHLYYGSLVQAVKHFYLDLFSYIGAFITWKSVHGAALILSPFEFLMPGKVIGVYVSMVWVSILTILLFDRILRAVFNEISPVITAMCSMILMIMPFQLGMFSYLFYDNMLVFFAVWLFFAYYKKDDLMIAFCGYLMAFTKITGVVYYAVFLIAATGYRVITDHRKGEKFFRSVGRNLTIGRAFLWMLPGFLFLGLRYTKKFFMVQYMHGAHSEPFNLRKTEDVLLTIKQLSGDGFRWMFWVIMLVALIVCFCKKRRFGAELSKDGKEIVQGLIWATAAFCGVLLVYNATCVMARYTALMNVFYAVALADCMQILFQKEKFRTAAVSVVSAVLLLQTYITIDPMILSNDSMVTGTGKRVYNLTNEVSMHGKYRIYSEPLYAYNYSSGFYDDLISKMLCEIQPSGDEQIFVLDVDEYEFHFHGMQYKMYWDTKKKRMVYAPGENTVYLKEKEALTEDICAGKISLPDAFYLVVAARVDESDAVKYLVENGYILSESTYENVYGAMRVKYCYK